MRSIREWLGETLTVTCAHPRECTPISARAPINLGRLIVRICAGHASQRRALARASLDAASLFDTRPPTPVLCLPKIRASRYPAVSWCLSQFVVCPGLRALHGTAHRCCSTLLSRQEKVGHRAHERSVTHKGGLSQHITLSIVTHAAWRGSVREIV